MNPAYVQLLWGCTLQPHCVTSWASMMLDTARRTRQARIMSTGAVCGCSDKVKARNPWGRDAAMDYEVMSDQEWEEEPEGESLSVSPSSACRPALVLPMHAAQIMVLCKLLWSSAT